MRLGARENADQGIFPAATTEHFLYNPASQIRLSTSLIKFSVEFLLGVWYTVVIYDTIITKIAMLR